MLTDKVCLLQASGERLHDEDASGCDSASCTADTLSGFRSAAFLAAASLMNLLCHPKLGLVWHQN